MLYILYDSQFIYYTIKKAHISSIHNFYTSWIKKFALVKKLLNFLSTKNNNSCSK